MNDCQGCKEGYSLIDNTCSLDSTFAAYSIALTTIITTISVLFITNAGVMIFQTFVVEVKWFDISSLVRTISTVAGNPQAQLFWIMLSNYQVIETFLLLEAELHESLIELLSSINFMTCNLNFINLPFIEHFKTLIGITSDPSSESLLENRMKNAGFEDNLFVADYMYFFIYLGLFIIGNLFFSNFTKVAVDPKTRWENFVNSMHKFYKFTAYLRLSMEAHFFITLAALVEFTQEAETATEIFSLVAAILSFTALQAFTVFVWYHYIYHRNDESIIDGPYQALYDGLKGDWVSKLYSPIFLLRRLVQAIILIFIRISIVQIIITVVLQISAIVHIVVVRPFQEKKDNLMSIVNEFVILIVMFIFLTMRRENDMSEDEVEERTQTAIWILCVAGIFALIVSLTLLFTQYYQLYKAWKLARAQRLEAKFNDAKSNIEVYSIDSDLDRGFTSSKKEIKLNDSSEVNTGLPLKKIFKKEPLAQ